MEIIYRPPIEPTYRYSHNNLNAEIFLIHSRTSKEERACLMSILARARESYLRYGDVPLFDSFDENSICVLIRVEPSSDAQGSSDEEEWLSVRFVRAADHRDDLDECFLCTIDDVPAHEALAAAIDADDPLSHLIVITKICGIPSVAARREADADRAAKLRHTPLSFALAKAAYMAWRPSVTEKGYVCGIFRPELVEHLSQPVHEGVPALPFYRAHELLKKEAGAVRIMRERVSYDYPDYFLNKDDLGALFARTDISVSRDMNDPQTRAYIEKHVRDAPVFYAMPSSLWKETLAILINHLTKIKGADHD